MRRQRKRKKSHKLYGIELVWLKNDLSYQPAHGELILLLLDDNGRRERLWEKYRPNEKFQDPIHYLNRLDEKHKRKGEYDSNSKKENHHRKTPLNLHQTKNQHCLKN